MSRSLKAAAVSTLAATVLLTGCQEEVAPQPGDASPAPTGTSATSAGDVGADGADASRREHLTNDGGYVIQGSRITFVYRNGMRYAVDTGQTIADRDSTLRTTRGVLILRAGTATWTTARGVTTVTSQGSGAVADPSGVIVVTPDGSTTCANNSGLQFVGSDGSRAIADRNGAFYTDKKGERVSLGRTPGTPTLAGRYTVCNVGNTRSVDLFSDVLFEFDSDRLTPAGRAVVANAASTIRSDVQGKTVNVVGHTDSKGTEAYNRGLGQRRAAAVSTELRARIPGLSLSTRSAGETEPVAANLTADGSDNPAGRAKNRRVTISWQK